MRISAIFTLVCLTIAFACNPAEEGEVADVEDDGKATVIAYLDDDTDEIKEASEPTQIAGTNLTSVEPEVAILYQLKPVEDGSISIFEQTRALFSERGRTIVNVEPNLYHILISSRRKTLIPPAAQRDLTKDVYTASVMNRGTTAAAIILDRLARTEKGSPLVQRGIVDLGLVLSTAVLIGPENIISEDMALTSNPILDLTVDRIANETLNNANRLAESFYQDINIQESFSSSFAELMKQRTSETTNNLDEERSILFYNNFVTVSRIPNPFPEAATAAQKLATVIAEETAKSTTVTLEQAKTILANVKTLEKTEETIANNPDSQKDQNNALVLINNKINEVYDKETIEEVLAIHESGSAEIDAYAESLSDPTTLDALVEEQCTDGAALTEQIQCEEEILASPSPSSSPGTSSATDSATTTDSSTLSDAGTDSDTGTVSSTQSSTTSSTESSMDSFFLPSP